MTNKSVLEKEPTMSHTAGTLWPGKSPSRECERDANAYLIAAAPDMLAAIQELLADKYLSDPINKDRMARCRAAVEKATKYRQE